MKEGYTILNAIMRGDNVIEVINHSDRNEVVNLGWVFPKTAYIAKNNKSVGVWKPKKLKN